MYFELDLFLTLYRPSDVEKGGSETAPENFFYFAKKLLLNIPIIIQ